MWRRVRAPKHRENRLVAAFPKCGLHKVEHGQVFTVPEVVRYPILQLVDERDRRADSPVFSIVWDIHSEGRCDVHQSEHPELVQLLEARKPLQELITVPFFVSAPLPGLDLQMFVPRQIEVFEIFIEVPIIRYGKKFVLAGLVYKDNLPVPVELPVADIVPQTVAANVQYSEIDDLSELLR